MDKPLFGNLVNPMASAEKWQKVNDMLMKMKIERIDLEYNK
jgi:hypothetical protein